MIAGTFHTCVHFSSADDHCFDFAGRHLCSCFHTNNFVFTKYAHNQEKPCLACRIERQGSPNQPVVSVDLDVPVLLSSFHFLHYTFIPQAFLTLQETRAPPLAV